MTRFLALAAAAALASPAIALAQSAQPAAQAPRSETRADFAKDLDQRFGGVDANRDGFITKAELEAVQAKALQQANAARQQEVEGEFKALDTDKNGSLSLAEFKAAVRPLTAPKVDEALTSLDKNKDGKVSLEEFRAPRLAMFDKVDANRDGTITEAEVKAAAPR